MSLSRVFTKKTKHREAVPSAYLAEVKPGISIEVKKDEPGAVSKLFKIGDQAEYDSFNLVYFGTIMTITAKTVTIMERFGSNSKSHRLSIYEFCWRNEKFDLNEVIKSNAETSMYI